MTAEKRFIKLPRVTELTSLKRSTVYERVKAGSFPAPYKVGERGSAWRSDEVGAWIDARPRAALGAS